MFKPFQINLCCPGKPKKSLDYIINWIDSASVTLNQLSSAVLSLQTWKDQINNDIISIVEDAAANFDYSSVIPELTTLSNALDELNGEVTSLNTAVNGKTSKVIPEAAGNLASLDALGNLIDSGKKASEFATAGHIHDFVGVEVDSSSYEGLVVRGKKYYPCVLTEQEADGDETHYNTYICTESINLRALGGITIEGPGDYTLEIETEEQMQNLKNATITPDSAPSLNSGRLITSGAVYNAVEDKLVVLHYSAGTIDKDTYIATVEGVTAAYITDYAAYENRSVLARFGIYDSHDDEILEYGAIVRFNLVSASSGIITVQIGTVVFTHDYTVSGGTVSFDDTIAWTKKSML